MLLQTPEFVSSFLHQLLEALHPHARRELELIRRRKQRDVGQQLRSSASPRNSPSAESPPVEVQPWDGAYYMGQLKASLFDLDADTLAAYFSLPNCIRGIDVVFQHVFGCQVHVASMQPGEDWTEVSEASAHTITHCMLCDQRVQRELTRLCLTSPTRPQSYAGRHECEVLKLEVVDTETQEVRPIQFARGAAAYA